ncbi:MAG: DUF4221 family protein [Crocinitomicaceae bacterium]|nr:DUF4221 family protein [Crocinitomicaceae bacterium]
MSFKNGKTYWLLLTLIALGAIFSISCDQFQQPVGSFSNDNDLIPKVSFSSVEIALEKTDSKHELLNFSQSESNILIHLYNYDNGKIDSYALENSKLIKDNYPLLNPEIVSKSRFALNESSIYRLDEEGVFWIHNEDSIIKLFDFRSALRKEKLSIDFSRIETGLTVFGDSVLFVPLHLDPESKGWVKPYGYPMTAKLNFKSSSLKLVGMLYPKHYHENDYGLIRNIDQVYSNEIIIYNPHAKDEVWVYDNVTDSIKKHPFRSKYQTTEILPLSFKSTPATKDLLWEHGDLSGEYLNLLYDPINKVYWRFFKHFRNKKRDDGFFTTYKEDVISVILADADFNILGEHILPKQCYFIYFAYLTRNGVIINNGSLYGEENDKLNLLRLNFTNLP